MSRHTIQDAADVTVERMRPEDVAAADELWLRTVDEAIEGEKCTISALQVHISEIDDTLSTLKTLHEKIRHEIMVPYGRVAMFKGQITSTNEVHVHLSSSTMVHTSTKHAQAVLRRRRDYIVEKQELVQQQLDALKSRRVFANSEKEQDGEIIEEIVEVYDEKVHGLLDGPMVRDEVYASRKYFGPPRNEAERQAHEADMEALRMFVAQHAEGPVVTADAQHDSHVGPVPDAMSPRSTDSDDEDSATLAQHPMHANLKTAQHQAAPLTGGPQLEQELDRLVAAFEGAAVIHDGGQGATDSRTPSANMLIQEVPTSSAAGQAPQRNAPDQTSGVRDAPAARATTRSSPPCYGLKHGFFDKAARPKKGILKKGNEAAADAALPEQTSGPQVSRSLVRKDARTASELNAFSGVVKERPQAAAAPHSGSEQQKAQARTTASPGVRKVSKFKSQRAAAMGKTDQISPGL